MHSLRRLCTTTQSLGVVGIAALWASSAFAESLQGYADASSTKQTAIEARFKAIPTPAETKRQHRLFTAEIGRASCRERV